MAEIQHSAGPWHVDPKAPEESYFEDLSILRPDGLAVAVAVHNGNITPDEVKANAFVLAAAPEMREALKLAKTWLEGWASAERELAIIDAALLKAEGRHG
jgi:hypothetical protein